MENEVKVGRKGLRITAVVFMFLTIAFNIYGAAQLFMGKGAVYEELLVLGTEGQGYGRAIQAIAIFLGVVDLIPICWQLPMTIHALKSTIKGKSMGNGFKVCTLIFVSLIGGILLLCDHNEPQANSQNQ